MHKKIFQIDCPNRPFDLTATPTVRDLKTFLAAKDRSDRSTLIIRLGSRILPDDFQLNEADLISGDLSWDYISSLPPRHVTFGSPHGLMVKTRYSKRTTVSKALQEICKALQLKNPDIFTVKLNGSEISKTSLLWSLPLSEHSILKIEEVPQHLKISYKCPDGHKLIASAQYRGIVRVQTVRTKIATIFQLQNAKTALFFGDIQLPNDSRLGDLAITEKGLKIRVIQDGSADPPFEAVHQIGIRTPKKLVKVRFKESVTVREAKVEIAKVLDLDAEQLLFPKGSDDGELLKDLDRKEGELRVHVYRPVRILFQNGVAVMGRFSEMATVKSTKEAIGKRCSIPVRNIHFDLDYSDDEKRLQDIELPESGVIKIRSNVVENKEEEDDGYEEEVGDREGFVKAPITRDDVSEVKIQFPDGLVSKASFRVRATVQKAREAAARKLGVRLANIVLSYHGDSLPDHMLITQLHIQRNRPIIVTVKK